MAIGLNLLRARETNGISNFHKRAVANVNRAARENAFETAEVLLKAGADVNANLGATPLDVAAMWNASETVPYRDYNGARFWFCMNRRCYERRPTPSLKGTRDGYDVENIRCGFDLWELGSQRERQ